MNRAVERRMIQFRRQSACAEKISAGSQHLEDHLHSTNLLVVCQDGRATDTVTYTVGEFENRSLSTKVLDSNTPVGAQTQNADCQPDALLKPRTLRLRLRQRPIVLLDSEYGCAPFVNATAHLPCDKSVLVWTAAPLPKERALSKTRCQVPSQGPRQVVPCRVPRLALASRDDAHGVLRFVVERFGERLERAPRADAALVLELRAALGAMLIAATRWEPAHVHLTRVRRAYRQRGDMLDVAQANYDLACLAWNRGAWRRAMQRARKPGKINQRLTFGARRVTMRTKDE